MNKAKTLDFTGHTIFCAMDAYKKSWRINNRDKDFELEDYSHDPCVENLYKHLQSRYPGGLLRVSDTTIRKMRPMPVTKNKSPSLECF
jgi:hypothetical protein